MASLNTMGTWESALLNGSYKWGNTLNHRFEWCLCLRLLDAVIWKWSSNLARALLPSWSDDCLVNNQLWSLGRVMVNHISQKNVHTANHRYFTLPELETVVLTPTYISTSVDSFLCYENEYNSTHDLPSQCQFNNKQVTQEQIENPRGSTNLIEKEWKLHAFN